MRTKKYLAIAIILTIVSGALFISCGTAKDGSSTRAGQLIPYSFFNVSFGTHYKMINHYHGWNSFDHLTDEELAPIAGRKIKSRVSIGPSSFGSIMWDEAVYLCDFKDSFFCIGFKNKFSSFDKAYSLYSELKAALDKKYGPGRTIGYKTTYGDPRSRSIILVMIPYYGKEDSSCCELFYLDDRIYRKDTAEAENEL